MSVKSRGVHGKGTRQCILSKISQSLDHLIFDISTVNKTAGSCFGITKYDGA